MKTSEKKTNSYRLQYWLYAILNKEFGREVKFTRDSLHLHYSVNRHGFEISTNTLSIAQVKAFLIKKLKEAKYLPEKQLGSDVTYTKVNQLQTGSERLYVDIDEQKRGRDSNNGPVLIISPAQYWTGKSGY